MRNTGECIRQSNRLKLPEREGKKRTGPKAKKKEPGSPFKKSQRVYELVVINSLEGKCGYGNTANASNLNSPGISALKQVI